MPEVYNQEKGVWTWMEYDDYLNTPWWRKIRRKRIEHDDMKCHDCGASMPLTVHHLTYDNLGCEPLDDLVTLCQRCHKRRHDSDEAARLKQQALNAIAEKPWNVQAITNKNIYSFAFCGFVIAEMRKRELNPRKYEDLKQLRTTFCELMDIDESDVGILSTQNYFSMMLHGQIDSMVLQGKSASQISRDLEVNQNTVYKRFRKLREIGESMKKLDLSNVEAMEQGTRDRIEAGGYVVKIIDVDDHEDREFLWLVFDIAEGEKRGFYTNDANREYYANKPNKHGILFSYKQSMSDGAKAMLKGKLKLITESNPVFDAEAAWNACKPEMFIGKQIGLVAGMEEYVYEGRDDGKWRKGESIDWFHARMKKPDDIRNGLFKIPNTIELSDDDKAKLTLQDSGATVGAVYDDIPFE